MRSSMRDVVELGLEEDDANNILFTVRGVVRLRSQSPSSGKSRPRSWTFSSQTTSSIPCELGAIERLISRVPRGRYVVLPASAATEGHRTQVKASVWADLLAGFLAGIKSP